MKKIHFIGIGGIGMSALARYFKAQKWAVSGSDMTRSQITDSLKKEGINVKIGHKKGNLSPGTGYVVISQAIREDNPELSAARKEGITVFTYPDSIAELTRNYTTIAVAGAHGKSTTTALTALTLIKGGLDPTVIVGTVLKEFKGSNYRNGKGSYLVLEADEFGNAFKRYSPAFAIVTNIDREHLDVYKNLANIKKAFLGFMGNVANGGALILNRDDKNLYSMKPSVDALAKRNGLNVIWYSLRDSEAKKIKRALRIPGEHNVSNSLAVYKLAKLLYVPEAKILKALGSYRGAWRRMERRGTFKGAPVYDDYAHHPTEITATLKAFKDKYPKKKLLCVFQPHQAKRLAALFKEFQTAFDAADETLILPTYRVAGRDEQHGPYDAQALVRAIQKKQPKKHLFYLPDPCNLKKAILTLDGSFGSKVIVMMGAGSIVNLTDSLLS